MRKLKFFIIGLIPGFIIVYFILSKKGVDFSMNGYFPNGRVIAETLSKDFKYSPEFTEGMKNMHISEQFLKDSIIAEGEINFDKSEPRKEPCGNYLLVYPKKNPKLEVSFLKCKEFAEFKTIKTSK